MTAKEQQRREHDEGKPPESVVMIHGMCMTGFEMLPLRWRLQRAGYRTYWFHYKSMLRRMDDNLERLRKFVGRVPGETVHYVGHSLGGVMALRFHEADGDPRPGRLVAIGSPFNGSWTANRVSQWPYGKVALGRTLNDALDRAPARWTGNREFGVVAGTMPRGVGAVLGGIPSPSDGTVSVEETNLLGATDHIACNANHFGLLASATVARHVHHFLRHGKFGHECANAKRLIGVAG